MKKLGKSKNLRLLGRKPLALASIIMASFMGMFLLVNNISNLRITGFAGIYPLETVQPSLASDCCLTGSCAFNFIFCWQIWILIILLLLVAIALILVISKKLRETRKMKKLSKNEKAVMAKINELQQKTILAKKRFIEVVNGLNKFLGNKLSFIESNIVLMKNKIKIPVKKSEPEIELRGMEVDLDEAPIQYDDVAPREEDKLIVKENLRFPPRMIERISDRNFLNSEADSILIRNKMKNELLDLRKKLYDEPVKFEADYAPAKQKPYIDLSIKPFIIKENMASKEKEQIQKKPVVEKKVLVNHLVSAHAKREALYEKLKKMGIYTGEYED